MKRSSILLIVGTAIVLGRADVGECTPTQTLKADHTLMLSATTRKSTATRQRSAPGQIACTVAGCQRIPPECHPETGYNWDGTPSGFDIVVCPPPRRRGD